MNRSGPRDRKRIDSKCIQTERVDNQRRSPGIDSNMPSYLADPVLLPEIRRVLVTKLRHHGDVLLTSPVFNALARALPAAEVDALVYRGTEPMLAGHPAIAMVHVIDRSWKLQGIATQVREEWRLLRRLRARRYDLLIHLTEHPRGLQLARLLRPRWSVTCERAKPSILWRSQFTHFFRKPKHGLRHTVEANLDALRRIGIYPEPADKRVVLVPDRASHDRAMNLLAKHGLAPGSFIHVHPGSRWLFKCWPAASAAELLDRIVEGGYAAVVTAAADDSERALVAAIFNAMKPLTRARTTDLSAQLTLPELAVITGKARAFVGMDSAPMHIAAAMGTPTVALFGPSDDRVWGPWQVASRVITFNRQFCGPCDIDGCGGGKVSECLAMLPAGRVYGELRSLLAETGLELLAQSHRSAVRKQSDENWHFPAVSVPAR